MSYNGVGLLTPRGSGTNGYVSRNLSLPRAKRQDLRTQDFSQMKPPTARKANKEILLHEAKRKIELQALELLEKFKERGYELRNGLLLTVACSRYSEEEAKKESDRVRTKLLRDFEAKNEIQIDQHSSAEYVLRLRTVSLHVLTFACCLFAACAGRTRCRR